MPPQITQTRVAFPEPPMGPEPAEWTKHELLQEHVASLRGAPIPLPLVVQFGSEQCALCPKATLDLDLAQKAYQFDWKYQDATTSSFAEELEVTALPALLVFHDACNYTLYQKLRGTDVTEIVKEHCRPRLVLDEDF